MHPSTLLSYYCCVFLCALLLWKPLFLCLLATTCCNVAWRTTVHILCRLCHVCAHHPFRLATTAYNVPSKLCLFWLFLLCSCWQQQQRRRRIDTNIHNYQILVVPTSLWCILCAFVVRKFVVVVCATTNFLPAVSERPQPRTMHAYHLLL
jgi:hypothetical protein